MTTAGSSIHPPRGLSRIFWRLPIWLYRLHLGWLLGKRFLMLEHVGRKSGKTRQVVVEVVKYEKKDDAYFVAAGFGPTSDWYQNLLKTPQARVHSGFRHVAVLAEVLPIALAEDILMDYARRHPTAIRALANILGYKVAKGEMNFREFANAVPMVRLKVDPAVN